MTRRTLGVLAVLLLLFGVGQPAAAESLDFRRAQLDRLLEQVNAFRQRHGLAALRHNARIAAAAQAHSETMMRDACFEHRCRGEGDLGSRLERAGYRYRIAAENIAAGFVDPDKVVAQWIRSDSHRENMLIPELTEAGVGLARMPRASDPLELGTYWTLALGTQGRGAARAATRDPTPPIPVRRP